MKSLTLTRPDDWHVHLRDGAALTRTVNDIARWTGRAIVMPNLSPPVRTVRDAVAYRKRIMAALAPEHAGFDPLMTLYLTDDTTPDTIAEAAECANVHGVKLYPAGATTNSDAGVNALRALYPTLEAMQRHDVPLLIHGEVTDQDIDIFDREKIFIERHFDLIARQFPQLRMVFEHITTADATSYVISAREGIAATITPQHLLYNRNDLLVGGIRPHLYCLPVLKRSAHQEALRKAATSGNPRFFLGTDSAPHIQSTKETACGCAGCYSGLHALPLYAEVFEAEDALEYLEGFASHHGPDFYRLPRNTDSVTIVQQPLDIPASLELMDERLIPLRAGEQLRWRLAS